MSIIHFITGAVASLTDPIVSLNVHPVGVASTLTFGSPEFILNTFLIATGSIDGERDTAGGTGTATAEISFKSDGSSEQRKNTNAFTDATTITEYNANTWINNSPISGFGDNYEIFGTINTETGTGTKTGTFDTWLSLSSDLSWGVQKTGNNVEFDYFVSIDFFIRESTTLITEATGTITLNAILFGP